MGWKDILGLAVIGACITTAGSLLAMYIKEFVAARWLERWKARQTLLGTYRRYQLPIFLAAEELSGRVYGLSRDDNDRDERRVGLDMLRSPAPREPHAAVSAHYLRYRFISNAYRLCCFLGWIELYRRDIGTLDVDALDHNRDLEACLSKIRSTLADGWLNQHEDWREWRDCLIFREELRAIGHRMAAENDALGVLDFGSFAALLESDPDGEADAKWFVQAALFYENLQRSHDFRLVRMKMLVVYLADLMELLQPGRIPRSYVESASRYRALLDTLTGGPAWRQNPLPDNASPAHASPKTSRHDHVSGV